MNKTVVFQSRGKATSSLGKQVENWTDYYTCFAAVFALSDKNFIEANAEQSFLTHNITIRYKNGIVPSMRIKYGSRIFIIQTVINVDERSRFLKLRCLEIFEDVI